MATVTVFLPTGTKAEANAARAALEKTGWKLVMATGNGHTPGQAISGDAVIVGRAPASLDDDIRGKIWRVDSINGLAKLDTSGRKKAAAPEPEAEQPALVTRREVEEPVADVDELEGMSRVELIQHAASRWPGEKRWATLTNDDLKATIRELSD